MIPPSIAIDIPSRAELTVVGGGVSGAALALIVRRRLPGARVVLIERRAAFPPGGTETARGVATLILQRALRVGALLAHEHLPCHGSRFWFADHDGRRLEEMSEIGSATVPELPAYHVDRNRLATSLLQLAADEGVRVARATKVTGLELGWPWSRLELESRGARKELDSRWVVDASGSRALLSQHQELQRNLESEPTHCFEARWSGVADLEGASVLGPDPRLSLLPATPASRHLLANHFCGLGWCVRLTPLVGDASAVRLALDPRRVALPRASTPLATYSRFVRSRPGLRELLRGASVDPDSFRFKSQVPWYPSRSCAPGWFLVGDAAGFLDPLGGAALDRALQTVWNAAHWIGEDLRGALREEELTARLGEHDRRSRRGFADALECLERGSYELFGDARCTAAAFFLGAAFEALGPVQQARADLERLGRRGWVSDGLATARSILRERLLQLALRRHGAGLYGTRNRGWRCFGRSSGLARTAADPLGRGLALWLALEYANFQARLAPVQGDVHESATIEIARHGALPRQVR